MPGSMVVEEGGVGAAGGRMEEAGGRAVDVDVDVAGVADDVSLTLAPN